MPDFAEFVDETGAFTPAFRESLPSMLDEDVKDTKVFDTIKDFSSLVKNHAHLSHRFGQKMENVIQKPSKEATPEQKNEYTDVLLSELGLAKTPEEYDFSIPTELPEGMSVNKEMEGMFRAFFHENKVPSFIVKKITEKFNAFQVEQYKNNIDAQKKVFEDSSVKLKTAWKGDDLIKNARIAHNAIVNFASPDLANLLKTAKIYDSAGNLEQWNSLGFSPEQLQVWANIGQKMKVSEHIPDEGTPKKGVEASSIYNHPTSVAEMNKS